MTSRLLLFVLALAFIGLRAPALLQELSADEISHAGAARHFVIHRDPRPAALALEPPLASHISSPLSWALSAPAPEWDAAGPGNQAGWRTLYETRAPDDSLVPPPVAALFGRLPMLLIGLFSLILLERFATRFYWAATGVCAVAIVAFSAGLTTVAARSVPAALAMPAMVCLMSAWDDHVRSQQYDGNPPAWLFRTRTLTCGAAVGLALATSYAFVPIVAIALVWLLFNRLVVRRRDDIVHAGAIGRAIKGALAAAILLGAVYVADFGSPLLEGGAHPALAGWCGLLGLDPATTASTVGAWTVPFPTWLRGLAHAGLSAQEATFDERIAALASVDGPLLVALALAGLAAWPMLSRDRADTPSLLGVLGYGSLATALVVGPEHAPVAALAAIPPLAVLVAAWLVRLSRKFKTGAALVGASLVAAIAGGWFVALAPSAEPGAEPGTADSTSPSHMTAEDEWVVNRWIAVHATERVVTVLGREPRLRIAEKSQVVETAVEDDALAEAATAVLRGDDVAIICGHWIEAPKPLLDEALTTEALGPRLTVYRATPEPATER